MPKYGRHPKWSWYLRNSWRHADHSTVRLGRNSLETQPAHPALRTYMAGLPLPDPPAAVNWYKSGVGAGALGNDFSGDCVPAAAYHQIQAWSANTSGLVSPTVDQAIDVYCRACGYMRDGGNGPGCVLSFVLQSWAYHGLAVGNDPATYSGQLLSGAFLPGEGVTCENFSPARIAATFLNAKGQSIIPSDVPVWTVSYQPPGSSLVIAPDKRSAHLSLVNAGNIAIKVAAGMKQGTWNASLAKNVARWISAPANLSSQEYPFQSGDIIKGNVSGARFQITGRGSSPQIHKILSALTLLRSCSYNTGIYDATKVPESRRELKLAIQLFGGAFMGVGLPSSAQSQGATWTYTGSPFNSWGGHCVTAYAYDSGYLYFFTWGHLYRMSWEFVDHYVDEAHALLSLDWLNANTQLMGSGIDFGAAIDDMTRIM